MDNIDLKTKMWDGMIKAAMVECFQSSAEGSVTVFKKPSVHVTVDKCFAVGKLTLACLSRSLAFVVNDGRKKNSPPEGAPVFRHLFKNKDGHEVYCLVRSDLKWPQNVPSGSARVESVQNIVAYWACIGKESTDDRKCNAVRDTKSITVKVGKTQYTLNCPIIVNTKPLEEGEQVVLSKARSDEQEEEPEPAQKRHRRK